MKEKLLNLSFILRLLFPIVLGILVSVRMDTIWYLVFALLEMGIILLIARMLRKWRIPYSIFNRAAMLLLNIQLILVYFANEFLTYTMLDNLNSLEDLSGNAVEYTLGAITVIVFSFLPSHNFFAQPTKGKDYAVTGVGAALLLAVEIILCSVIGTAYSPTMGYVSLVQDWRTVLSVSSTVNSDDVDEELFYSDGITQYYDKDEELVDQPNVILIFTEGLSQNIVEDERDIMPNVRALEEESIVFENYYNHTFPTYRGLIGQLYSGYQFDLFDENHLVSLQQILSEQGYTTEFINTEPNNSEFTEYLERMGFDYVDSEYGDVEGMTDTYSDRQAYEELLSEAERLGQEDEPFFLSIYTFGTHVSLDSTDVQYGDGTYPALNKFYNVDYWFGEFFEAFKESELSENTILIFTTDHATYAESDVSDAGLDEDREDSYIDTMPLAIYYEGVTPTTIDAGGRNSLDLVPTILDFLDISVPNYFLGQSLFGDVEDANVYETTYVSQAAIMSTENCTIQDVGYGSKKYETVWENVLSYYGLAQNAGEEDDGIQIISGETNQSDLFIISIDDDGIVTIETSEFSIADGYAIKYYVWNDENRRDDLQCYYAELGDDGTWIVQFDLASHMQDGMYCIDAYEGNENEDTEMLGEILFLYEE